MPGSDLITSEPPYRINFLHTVLAQCGLPHRNPGNGVREWDRRQGALSLRVESGSALDPRTGDYVRLGLPYGEKPRLVMIHLSSEAVRTGAPVVEVEDSLTAYVRSLGLNTGGRTIRTLKDQLGRLAVATIRLGLVEAGRAIQVNTQVIDALELWAPADPRQKVLWPSTVRLSDRYFGSLLRHGVPLDHRAVGALAHSSLALDVYTWLSQRLHRVPARRPQTVPWEALKQQFGPDYTRTRRFREVFLAALHQVQAVYPSALIEPDDLGLSLRHSPPPVPRKSWPALGRP
jgi:Plasmid encoded RepA protein